MQKKANTIDPVENKIPNYSSSGVDLTLIRWMAAMTPAERLATLQRSVATIIKLRNARKHT